MTGTGVGVEGDTPGPPSLRSKRAGPVALVGSGEFLPTMEEHDGALLAGRPPRAVFLPTAAAQEGPERVSYWLRLGEEHFGRLGVEAVPLAVLDRAGADDPAMAAAVDGAGLVYLSGGNPGYLADTLRDSRVLAALLRAWRGGAALAGCSAGACALTDLAMDMRRGGEVRPGLSVVPGIVVLPHFDQIERWWPGLVETRRAALAAGQTLIGIDEDTALTAIPERPGVFAVSGRRSVWVFDGGGAPTAYAAGEQVRIGERGGNGEQRDTGTP
jgi:cyanophycinase